MMTHKHFQALLNELIVLKHELRGIECKGPGSRQDKQFLATVMRAVLGMANRRDGGRVIIGVEDLGTGLNPKGLTDEQISTWKYDDLSDSVSEYAEPSIDFDSSDFTDESGKRYILIDVKEFQAIPILCKKSLNTTLRKGACYVRSRRKPETTEIPTQEDMRDLLDLATEKGIRKFLQQSAAAGILSKAHEPPSDKDLFDRQVADLR